MAVREEYGSQINENVETGEWDGSVTWVCDTRAEAMYSVPVFYEGLALTTKSIVPWKGTTQFAARCKYQGQPGEASDGDEDGTFEIIPEEREVPIESYPDREFLVENYGAFLDGDVLKFPQRIPRRASSGTGLAPVRGAAPWAAGSQTNPLNGVRTFPMVYEVAIRTFFRKRFPARLDRQANTIIDELPAGFSNLRGPEKREWWVEKAHRVGVGDGVRITWRARSLEGQPALRGLIAAQEESA
jgi:hypothetical protein